MKRAMKKALGVVCALSLILSSSGLLSLTALAEEYGGDSQEISCETGGGSSGQTETGAFVVTGGDGAQASPSGEEDGEDVPSSVGSDDSAAGETLSVARDAPLGSGGDDLGAGVVTPDATPTVSLSQSTLSLKKGDTGSVTVTVSGYPAGSYLQTSNGNSAALSCVWGSWRGTSIPLRITGKGNGGGSITVNLKDTSNKVLASETIQVTAVEDNPSLSVSPSSLSMDTGDSAQSRLTILNYSGGGSVAVAVDDRSVCSAAWGSWSGKSIPVIITGKEPGATKVTLKLYNTLRTLLASVTLNVTVNEKVSLSVSPSSLSVNTGKSANLTITASGTVHSGDEFSYSLSNSAASGSWSGKWDGKSAKLTLAGKTAGKGSLTVTLKNSAGTVLATKEVDYEVVKSKDTETVSVSPASVTVSTGASVKVNCTAKNLSGGSISMKYVNNSPNILSCAWKSGWSGNTVPLTITGKTAGTGSVTVQLLVNSQVRASADISVTVPSAPPDDDDGGGDDGGGGGGGGSAPFSGYGFDNYSKPGISLDLCQFMFGKTQRARTVYEWDIGNGGVCFGMSSTVGLLAAGIVANPGSFGRSLTSEIKKSDYSNGLGLSASSFIEAMHISQVASSMKEYSGLDELKDAVRSGGTEKPVIVCVRGPEGGHAIVGYGVTSSGNLKIYDPNWPGQERTLKISESENTWSYELWSGLTWGSDNGKITYIPYSVYSSVWRGRGTLNGVRLQGAFLNEDQAQLTAAEETPRYLLVTSADDFELYDFEDNLSAKYVNGVLTEHLPEVEEVFVERISQGGDTPDPVHMLYVPEDLYTVKNLTGKTMDVVLTGDDLSVHVNTEAEDFYLAVEDQQTDASGNVTKNAFANACVNSQDGESYTISLGSSIPGDPDNTTIEGTGNGEPISLGMDMNGSLYISTDRDGSDGLSLGEMEDEETSSGSSFAQDFTLNSSRGDDTHTITTTCGEGGTVTPSGNTQVLENGSLTCQIQPKDGYSLRAVYVNGEEIPYGTGEDGTPGYTYYNNIYEYTFRDVTEPGTLHAEFAMDINLCEVHADYDSGVQTVTVVDKSGGEAKLLQEGTDYLYSLMDSEEDGETYLVVQAVSGGAYYGVYQTQYTYHTQEQEDAELFGVSYDPLSGELNLMISNAPASYVLNAAVFAVGGDGQTGRMVAYLADQWTRATPSPNGVPVSLKLDAASLPEKCVVKVFLLDSTDTLHALAEPATVNVAKSG